MSTKAGLNRDKGMNEIRPAGDWKAFKPWFYSQSESDMLISEDEFEAPPMSLMPSPTNDVVTSLSSQSIETFVPDTGVGLSNPQLSHGRRRMLDLVNKLHSTGYVSHSCLSALNLIPVNIESKLILIFPKLRS